MSAIDTNRSLAGAAATYPGPNLLARLAAWNNARMTRKSLHRLSDRELDDIGLCRGDIEDVARRT